MAFWKWSRTASSNATADNTVNWAEGMAPSAVNDSARAMMARLAEWRDDVSGTITTAGSSTAYTVASNQGFDNLADLNGAMIAFVPHATNGATVTLNVDGLGAKPLRLGPSLELQSGILIQGTPYAVSYNNADGAFYLQGGFANPYGIPLGGMMPYIGSSAPEQRLRAALRSGDLANHLCDAVFAGEHDIWERRWIDYVQRAGFARPQRVWPGQHGGLGGEPHHGRGRQLRRHGAGWDRWRAESHALSS